MRLLGGIPITLKSCQNRREFALLIASVDLILRPDISIIEVMPHEMRHSVDELRRLR